MHRKFVRDLSFTAVLLACIFSVGCISCSTRQNPDELREKTAQTTAELKSDAKAIAQGIHEGLKRDEKVDINHAPKAQLTKLPGVDEATAEKMIGARPYKAAHELVTRRVVSEEEYQRMKDHITLQ
jgi:DNA uptake protein ComE-like DNA-binding protein